MLIGYIFQSTSDPAASTAVVEAEVHSYDDVPDNGYHMVLEEPSRAKVEARETASMVKYFIP